MRAQLPRIPEAECLKDEFGDPVADQLVPPWGRVSPLSLALNNGSGAPEQGTEVRIGYDAHSFRVLFACEDPMPWATFTVRGEPLYKEEVVEVFLDVEGDGLAYYELELNPNNAVLDVFVRRVRSGFRKDFRWRCEGLRTAVRVTEGGWIGEFAIPFESICASPPREGTRWRANFTRIDRPKDRPRELSSWSPTGMDQFHIPDRFGTVVFG
jgi:hypothetical protein